MKNGILEIEIVMDAIIVKTRSDYKQENRLLRYRVEDMIIEQEVRTGR